jgi:four helix bundle protein
MFPYEQLDVYKMAFETNQKIYKLLKKNDVIASYARNQLGRACLSIMLNIAEGSAKHSCKDKRNFFITARGSTFECSALICFLHEDGAITTTLRDELYNSFDRISRILFTMIKNLERR